MVGGDDVLQRDGDRFVKAAGFGRAEHRGAPEEWQVIAIACCAPDEREVVYRQQGSVPATTTSGDHRR
jgi:hypothetical protein